MIMSAIIAMINVYHRGPPVQNRCILILSYIIPRFNTFGSKMKDF